MKNCIVHKNSILTAKAGKNNIFKIDISTLKDLAFSKKKIKKQFLEILTMKGFSPVQLIEKIKSSSLVKITLEDDSYIEVNPSVKMILSSGEIIEANDLQSSHILFGRKKIKSVEKCNSKTEFSMYSIQMKSSESIFINDILISI